MYYFSWLSEPLTSLILCSARVYIYIYVISLFAFKEIKGVILYSIAFTLTITPALYISEQVDFSNIRGAVFFLLFVKELLLGLIVGLMLAVPFWIFESTGALFDNQRGVLMGEQINPAMTTSNSVSGYIIKSIFIITFIYNNGFSQLVALIWDSYVFWPVDSLYFSQTKQVVTYWLLLLSESFISILVYSAPFSVLLLLIDFSIAILSLHSPRMQVTLIALPTKILISIAFLIVYIPGLVNLSEKQIIRQENIIHNIPNIIRLSKD